MAGPKFCPHCYKEIPGEPAEDLKPCPFCLELIPARAIKCRYCESMVDDISPTADKLVAPTEERRQPPAESLYVSPGKNDYAQPRDKQYYPSSAKKKRNRLVLPLVAAAVVLVLLLGAGGIYWFLQQPDQVPPAEVSSGDVIGSWRGATGDKDVYFQFLPNEMVNVAVPPEEYWFRTQYRLIKAEEGSYLELYHRGKAEWERTSEIVFGTADTMTMVDYEEGTRIAMERVPDPEFREVINELAFAR